MNYIKLINAFWQLRRGREDFDPYVIALYFALVSKANKAEWKTFRIYREDIIQLAGMGPSTYYRSRKILKDAGAIDYDEGASKLSQCCFTIHQLYATRTEGDTEESTEGDTEGDTEESTEGDTVDDTIYINNINLKTGKPLNPKTRGKPTQQDPLTASQKKASGQASAKEGNEKGAAGAGAEPELVYPFDTETFREAWGKWIAHKQRIKRPFKSRHSEQMALMRLSHFDEQFSTQLIENSIERGWEGLIYDRTKGEYQKYLNEKSNGTRNIKITATAARGGGIDLGFLAAMVVESSATPERYAAGQRGGSGTGQNGAGQNGDGSDPSTGDWGYPGEYSKEAG